MLKQLLIYVVALLALSGCVIHLKPGISWCTNKTCIYEAYGLYAVKDFAHRAKGKIARIERKAKRSGEHHTAENTRIATKKSPSTKEKNVILIAKDTFIVSKEIPITIKDTAKPLANLRINFAFDKDTISGQDKINIREYMKKIPIETTSEILIKGFTDNAGTEVYNKHLSMKRARRIYDYLISLGIPHSKLIFKGFDFKDPVADNKTEEGRSLNRRVEIEILYRKSL
jgi:outer membrane protein OmpA-like peptidoglycan-associated protein